MTISLSPEEERFLESIRADQVRECDASARDLIIPPILIERISALARQSRNGFDVVYGLRYRNTLRIFPYRSYLLTQITEIVRDVSSGAHTMTVMYFSNYFIHRLRGRINQLQEPVEVPSESLHG